MKKVAIISGAASGLGKRLAFQLVEAGYRVKLLDINRQALEKSKQELQENGRECSIAVCDVSEQAQLQNIIQSFVMKHGRLDIMINCAGYSITGAAEKISIAAWKKIIDVNLLGTIYGSQLAYQLMKEQGYGQIVNISSMFGILPAPSGIAYATTKHGVMGFTKTLAVEAKEYGVTAQLVCPGFIETSFFENAEYVGVEKERMLRQIGNLIPLQQAVDRVMKGIERKERMIIFPFYVRVLLWIEFFFPQLAFWMWQEQMKKYRKMLRE